jgi:hypothetical protein
MMFVFKMGKDGRETFKMLKVNFGEHTVERTQVLECFLKFRSGVTSVEDSRCSKHPSVSRKNVDKLKETILINRGITV